MLLLTHPDFLTSTLGSFAGSQPFTFSSWAAAAAACRSCRNRMSLQRGHKRHNEALRGTTTAAAKCRRRPLSAAAAPTATAVANPFASPSPALLCSGLQQRSDELPRPAAWNNANYCLPACFNSSLRLPTLPTTHFSSLVSMSTRACEGSSGFANTRGSGGRVSGGGGSYSGSPASANCAT